MTIISAIQLMGAAAGLAALVAAIIPRRPFSRWHPRGFIILLLAVLTGTHVLSALEHMGVATLDRTIDFARVTTPILWFFLLYSWAQSDASRQLAESEERFRLFMDHCPNEAFIKDEQGRYVFGNKTWQARFRRPLEEILGKTDFDLWPQETASLFRRTDDLTRHENRLVHEYESGTDKDGQPRWFDVYKFPITKSDGKRLVAGIVHDITDMRLAELERQASDERYRLMFEHNPLPMWLYDPKTLGFIDVNAAAIAHYGYSRDEFCAMTLPDICPPEDVPQFLAFQRNPKHRMADIENWRHRKKDGTVIHVHVHYDEIEYLNRFVRIAACIDVTDRFEAEAALHESQHLLEQAQQVAHVGSWWSDIDMTNGKLHWSKETHRICGIPEDQFDNRLETFFNLVHPDDRERVLQASIAASHQGKTYAVDHRLIRPDGQIIWVHERADILRDIEGNPLRMVGICQDITERKRSEEALRASEERYRNIVEDQTEMIARWLPDGTLHFVNEAYARFHNQSAQEIIGTNFLQKLPEQSSREILALIATMTPTHPSCSEVRRKVMPDGREVWQSWSNRGFFDDKGQLTMVQSVGLDVTDRKLAEEAQQRLTQTQSAILNALPANIALLDSQGVIVSVNEAWRRFASEGDLQGPDFFLGENYLTACMNATGERAGDAHLTAKGIARVLQGLDSEFILEYPCHTSTEQHWFRLIATPVHEKQQAGAVIMHIDITDRKLAEANMARLAAIIEFSVDAVVGKDLNNVVTSWNRGAEHIFGYTAKEMVGSSITRLIPSDRSHEEPMIFERIFQGGTIEPLETKRRTQDGRLIDVSITFSPICDATGQVVGVSQVARDITDRKGAAALVEEWRNRYEAAVHASRQIMYDWNSKSNAVVVAGATERLLGCKPADLDTLAKWESRIHPDDLPAFHRMIEQVNRTFEPFELEYRFRRDDGSYLEMEDFGFFFADAQGQRTRMVGFLSDITARKEAERQRLKLEMELSHKQKMEAVGNLASGIAHDFSNVLTAIQGHLSLAGRGLLPDHPARKSLRMVEQAAQQGVDMTKSITAFAQKTPSEKTPSSLAELTTSSLRLFRHLLPQNIEIDYQPPTGTGPWIAAARSQIQQVVMNLILNARDAMPDGGTISVRLGTMSKDAARTMPLLSYRAPRNPDATPALDSDTLSADDSMAVLSVTDTGCGMNQQTMARIFEPFYTTKDRHQGTGLGLAMVHSIVTEHNGSVAVESEPDQGTRFDVFLPMCAPLPPEPVASAPASRIPDHRPRFVLVLHPENFVGEILTTSLESAGYVVVMAHDAGELIEQLNEHANEVGALVVDADVLPENEDEPAVFALQRELLDTPLVVISSNMAQFLDEPFAQKLTILPKPFQMSKLISLVDRAVGIIPSGGK